MNSIGANIKSRDFLVVMFVLQAVVCTLVFFDVPVARQVVGFAYLTFIPGFVVIRLLKLDKLDRLEIVLLSVGFSVAFLMFGGLLANELGSLLGISQPLSLMPLIVIFNSIALIGVIVAHMRSDGKRLLEAKTLGISPVTALLAVLPILAVVGAMWVNIYDSNLILLLLLIVISLIFVIGTISHKLSAGFYAVAVFAIAISLLFHSSLISRFLVSFGSDSPAEFFVFKITLNNAFWSSVSSSFGRLNSMLSITILPTIYSVLLNLDATILFKIMYPIIFAFVSLALYKLWQTNFGKKNAFVAAFLLMAQLTFYTEMLGLNRQIVAELFFVLLLLTLSTKMTTLNKTILFVVFSFAIIVSHYALALIFLAFILFAWIYQIALKRPNRNITTPMIVLFSAMLLFWYVFTSNSATFDTILQFGNHVLGQLGNFFNLGSRGEMVLRGLGLASSPSVWNTISRAFAYLTELFIIIGFVGLILRRKNLKLNNENFTFIVAAMAILVALIVVPGLANTLNITRFYHILLFFLAPLCILGVETLVKPISKRRTTLWVSILLVIMLVPYFLFQTSFIYEVVGVQSDSLSLSKYRIDATLRSRIGYFDESEEKGVLWISKTVDFENSTIGSDSSSTYYLFPANVVRANTEVLSNTTVLSTNDIVYLNRANLVDEIFGAPDLSYQNTTSYLPNLRFENVIYSNGGCEIYGMTISP